MLILLCRVDSHRLGLRLDQVVEVLPMPALFRVPETPSGLLGFFNFAGDPTPALALRALFGAPAPLDDVDQRIVLCRSGGGLVGLVVDDADAVVTVTSSTPSTESAVVEAIATVGETLCLVIDVAAAAERLRVHAEPALPSMEAPLG